jgi:hypothetical protein
MLPVLAGLALALGASSAQATTVTFATAQILQPGGAWAVGPAHTLTSVDASGTQYCINAINVAGGALAGAGACTAGTAILNHPFCACALRDGVGYAYYPTTYYGYLDWATESF